MPTFAAILAFLGAAPIDGALDLTARNSSRGVRKTLLFERALRWRLERLPAGACAFRQIESVLAAVAPDLADLIPMARREALRAEYDLEDQRLRLMSTPMAERQPADRNDKDRSA
ncbi:MAG: hypothetical protein GC152_01320 [Alphaproteobacteria bacterium]|nr:hypothetical protein [Alphaproteobacteria bacterium]